MPQILLKPILSHKFRLEARHTTIHHTALNQTLSKAYQTGQDTKMVSSPIHLIRRINRLRQLLLHSDVFPSAHPLGAHIRISHSDTTPFLEHDLGVQCEEFRRTVRHGRGDLIDSEPLSRTVCLIYDLWKDDPSMRLARDAQLDYIFHLVCVPTPGYYRF